MAVMEITVKLSMEQWNQVLDMLSDAPVRKAIGLINTIVAQAKEQMPAGQPENGVVLKE